jgi:hypothetical protein
MNMRLGWMGALVFCTCASAANAAAIGSAGASVSLLLGGASSSGGSYLASTFIPDPSLPKEDTSNDPGGFANVFDASYPPSGGVPIQVGDEIAADVSAGLQAVGPLGLANAFIQAGVFLQATNTTASDLNLNLLFGVNLFSDVSVTDPSLEFSVAFSDVSALLSDEDEFGLLFRAVTEADSDFGPLEDSVPETFFPFSLTLAPNTSRTIALTAVAQIDAASLVPAPVSVPLPLTAILLGQALVLLPFTRVAKRTSRQA